MTEDTRTRPVRLPRDERRTQLLAAATEVFVANGYHAAAMDEIAEAASVSKPVLYQHFPSKRELYIALLDLQLVELTERMLAALASTDDNRERVQATISAYFEFISKEDQAHRLIFENDLVNDPEVAAKIEAFNATYANAIAGTITRNTTLSEGESTLLGRALAGMSQVSARYWLESGGEIEREVAEEVIYRLAWRGISNFPMQSTAEES
ncbi:AcrR family transcriptional regulator [Psychromicrobium silvestre]|uniref:AcrR family transcriptional regulator n=1 Tax=Psychromicrobium silvestre TaxID=1645614 RepID=A0A7Y9LSZ9_9MICC|nr:TetR/AcrR family transcriptional regulator [Psychromicrobium silvestre]NYE95039.1 AcrR family transcriptional regulator [Psychromicrobium silvestre]